jgi:transposase
VTLDRNKDGRSVDLGELLPRRWVAERSFAWISHNRRMSKDYVALCTMGEALVYAAAARLMTRRLAPV